MAYIVVTTDEGTVIFKKHHTQYPAEDGHGIAKLLNDLSSATLKAEMLDSETKAKSQHKQTPEKLLQTQI